MKTVLGFQEQHTHTHIYTHTHTQYIYTKMQTWYKKQQTTHNCQCHTLLITVTEIVTAS